MISEKDPEWFEFAACRATPVDVFFRDISGRPDSMANLEAKVICKRCPVRDDCLTFAIARGEHFGIWGGMTPTQRRAYARANNLKIGRPSYEWLNEFHTARARSAREKQLKRELENK